MRPLSVLAFAAVAAIAATFAGRAPFGRPKQRRWGATDEETARTMPLDGEVPEPGRVSTRAVTIRARPDEVWFWIAQIGETPRAGFYSAEWIERLPGMDLQSSSVILHQFQHPAPGEAIDRAGAMLVKAVDDGRWLVLAPPAGGQSTWCLALFPVDAETTRLVTRVRARLDRSDRGVPIWSALTGPGAEVLEGTMLDGIKERAEKMADERRANVHVFEEVLLEAMKSA